MKRSIDGTADNRVEEYELAAPLQINFLTALDVHLELLTTEVEHGRIGHTLGIRLDDEVNLAKLSGTTTLLLVTILGLGFLGNGLTVRHAGLIEDYTQLLVVFQTPLQRTQMELSLTVNDGLAQLLATVLPPMWGLPDAS